MVIFTLEISWWHQALGTGENMMVEGSYFWLPLPERGRLGMREIEEGY